MKPENSSDSLEQTILDSKRLRNKNLETKNLETKNLETKNPETENLETKNLAKKKDFGNKISFQKQKILSEGQNLGNKKVKP